MSLNDICYEQIKDNFWYGIFGDFKLIIDKSTGYFNATKLCASGGKRFDNWLRNKQSVELLEYLQLNPSPHIRGDEKNQLFKEVLGGNCDTVRGTYVPKQLILAIASWVSYEFHFKCSEIVLSYFVQDFTRMKTQELEQKILHIEKSLSELSIQNQKLKSVAAPYTNNPNYHNCFLIIRKNVVDSYPYYTIRVQKISLKYAMAKLETRYPNYDVIFNKDKDPNSVKLLKLMIQELPIEMYRNSFRTTLTEEELTDRVEELYDTLL